jgi:OTU-like cysteine protease
MGTVSSEQFRTSSGCVPLLTVAVLGFADSMNLDDLRYNEIEHAAKLPRSESHKFIYLQGREKDHGKIREQVVQYMEKHRDEFAPFVEDDEGFEKYLTRMRRVSSLMATCCTLQVERLSL